MGPIDYVTLGLFDDGSKTDPSSVAIQKAQLAAQIGLSSANADFTRQARLPLHVVQADMSQFGSGASTKNEVPRPQGPQNDRNPSVSSSVWQHDCFRSRLDG